MEFCLFDDTGCKRNKAVTIKPPPTNVERINSEVKLNKVPSRTIGIPAMIISIFFTAYWMSLQGSLVGPVSEDLESSAILFEGFRSDAWQLPDDEFLGFVEIASGQFTMGSNPAVDRMAYENERWSPSRRQGSVDLPTYYIARFETTNAQYRKFLLDTNAPTSASAADMIPITNITWPEALSYARWLDTQLRQSSLTPEPLRQFLSAGGRVNLPTEAEWEKAARGSDARIFPWGAQPSGAFANFNGTELLAVGSKACPDCSYGLSDMAGNVWEYTRSPAQDYPYDPNDDFQHLIEGALWVMRGGSYADPVNNVRTAVRGSVGPGVRNSTIGFRLAISQL